MRLGLGPAGTSPHQLFFYFALVQTGLLFHIRRYRQTGSLQLLLKLAQGLALGIDPGLQRRLDLHRLGETRLDLRHRLGQLPASQLGFGQLGLESFADFESAPAWPRHPDRQSGCCA